MATFLNSLMVLMNFASGTQIDGKTYLVPPEQFSAKIEVVFLDQGLVEEFHIIYDRSLRLARYEYSLDEKMAPYYTRNPMRTVCDYNTGTFYDMDLTTGNCAITYLAPAERELNTRTILQMVSPEQLFSINAMLKFVKKDYTRGIESDVWTSDIDDFYVAGYGTGRTRHTLRTLSGAARKFYRGSNQSGVLLQRSIQFVTQVNITSDPVLTINYFDFEIPRSPQIFDFNVMPCVRNVKTEPTEEILIRFSGRLNMPVAQSDDPTINKFRRTMWQEFSKSAGISPVRSLGNFWSQDDWSTYFTTVVLPRPNPTTHFLKAAAPATVKFMGQGADSGGARAMEMGFQMLIQTCAERCFEDKNCGQFAWCPGNTDWNMFICVLQPDMDAAGLSEKSVLTKCELYQEKPEEKREVLDVTAALEKLGKLVYNQKLTVKVDGTTLVADSLRRNVSLMASTKSENSPDALVLYVPFTTIIGNGVRSILSKLTSKQCTERCISENGFICQSIATCGYGDCFLSDLHGDELQIDSGKYLANHSHCAVWSRESKRILNFGDSSDYVNSAVGVWTNEYVKISRTLFSKMEPHSLSLGFVEREETCAKQCSFPGTNGCESFSWCPKSVVGGSGSTCSLFPQHVFDRDIPTVTDKLSSETCFYYTKNYLVDFVALPRRALTKDRAFEYVESEVVAHLGDWRCAKSCIDGLADACMSFEVCDFENNHEVPRRCRLSPVYVSQQRRKPSNVTVPHESCIVYARTRYPDGTPVTGRIGQQIQIVKVDRQGQTVHICMTQGYSATDMTALAICMLVLGCIVVVTMFFAVKKFYVAREVSFVRFRDKG